jgi:hypothetical protein
MMSAFGGEADVRPSWSAYDPGTARSLESLISLQLSLAPVMVLAIRINGPLVMPVDGLQRCRPGEEHRVALLGGPGEMVRRVQHLRMIMLDFWHRLAQVLDRVSQRRQCRAVVQYDRFLKALRPTLRNSRQGGLTELVLRR